MSASSQRVELKLLPCFGAWASGLVDLAVLVQNFVGLARTSAVAPTFIATALNKTQAGTFAALADGLTVQETWMRMFDFL